MVQVACTSGTLEKQAGKGQVLLLEGDLTTLRMDAVVYYAREDLALGSGYGTAIQTRGGDSVREELAAIGGVCMGEAVITGAGSLHARHIIHACGPKFQEERTEEKLRACMQSALALAESHGLASVAFSLMGAGPCAFAGCTRVPSSSLPAALRLPGILGAGMAAGAFLLAYIPMTHMAHFIAKYFTYHQVRWDESANVPGGSIEKRMAEYLMYRPTWSAPHIATGDHTWAEIATCPPGSTAKST